MGADKTCHLWQVIFFVQILYTNIRNRNRNPEVVNHKPQSARLLTTSVVCYQKNAAIGKTEIKNQILNGG